MIVVIYRWKGLRDDLTCILDEDLSSVSLCALHCEMRNTEQLLKNVGLMAYQIGSLEECNSQSCSCQIMDLRTSRQTGSMSRLGQVSRLQFQDTIFQSAHFQVIFFI